MSFIMPMRWPLVDPLEHKREECYGSMNHEMGLTKVTGKYKQYVGFGEVSLPVPYVVGGFSPEVGSLYQPPPNVVATTSKQPKPLTKEELDTIVADSELLKRKSEELASSLKHRNFLAQGVNVTSSGTRDADLKKCFKVNSAKKLRTWSQY